MRPRRFNEFKEMALLGNHSGGVGNNYVGQHENMALGHEVTDRQPPLL